MTKLLILYVKNSVSDFKKPPNPTLYLHTKYVLHKNIKKLHRVKNLRDFTHFLRTINTFTPNKFWV